MRRFTPLSPDSLPGRLADVVEQRHPGIHPARVALDAPVSSGAESLAQAVCEELSRRGRPSAVVRADAFLRDASVRLEYGHTDVESFYSGWLDREALQREVLAPLAADGEHRFLPSLRNPDTNRATRERPRTLDAHGVLVVVGSLLLGNGLDFDLVVHLNVSRAARRRQTPEQAAWTLPAYDRYDIDIDPSAVADVVIRYDDPAHPAVAEMPTKA